MDAVLTANSPGEVGVWAPAAIRALHEEAAARERSLRVWVFLTPCAWATGEEAAWLAARRGVDGAYAPRETLRFLFLGLRPARFVPPREGAVLYLGGDLAYGAWLARRLRLPAVAYTDGFVQWRRRYCRFATPDEQARQRALRRGAAQEQVVVTGDLMVDGVQGAPDPAAARRMLGLGGGPVLALFPGSRSAECRHTLPLFTKTLQVLTRRHAGLQAVWSVSPFLEQPGWEAALRLAGWRAAPDAWERLARGGLVWLDGPGGMRLLAARGEPAAVMQASDVALTLPGSNTAELAALGRPFVTAIPIYMMEEVPLDGLAQYVTLIPVAGRRLKRRLVRRYADRTPIAALPNRRAGEIIAPEVRLERPDVEAVARPVSELLADPHRRRRLGERLKVAIGPSGAARKLAALYWEVAEGKRLGGSP